VANESRRNDLHAHAYLLTARSIADGTCGCLQAEERAILHLTSAMASGAVDVYIVLAVFLDPTSIL